MSDSILLRRISLISDNATERVFKSLSTSKYDPSLSSSVEAIHHIHRQDRCNIEVFGGFRGVEQTYISGTLLKDIRQTCSCYTHYQSLDKLLSNKREKEVSPLYPSHGIGRVIWCDGTCPDYIRNWCKNKLHRDYCQKHVVLFELSDEASGQPIDHYSYFAAVYRNYLRHATGNRLSYLTKHIRNLPQTNETLRIHRILNWSLAIDIMRDEWKAATVNIDDFSIVPPPNVTAQINNRIIERLLHNNEGITYHTWSDLDTEIRKYTKKNVSVFWFPLGYTNIYLDNTVQFSIAPLSQRQKLWTWSGSMKLNERSDMTKSFETKDALTAYVKQRGMLTITSAFAQGVKFMDYTSQLLESQFVPLPRGGSPEQFRSYEASNAGAILIVNEEWLKIGESKELAPLAYLNILGYDPVTITHFKTLPKKLFELSRLPPELLDDWQSIMLSRHRIVMDTMTKHIASVVCAANTPQGYRFQNM